MEKDTGYSSKKWTHFTKIWIQFYRKLDPHFWKNFGTCRHAFL
ncbi:hypothetical protein HMPREF1869_00195 [Bacteroidales bacterium KA00251]|nr:hypothetical protein HMPREF1869_00195 [Bacteroidales bacterium KA00251]